MGDKAILIVDDDEAILRACQRGIGRCARLFTAATPDQARKVVRTERLDAIVVDHRLGDRETGVDLPREFRDRVPKGRIGFYRDSPTGRQPHAVPLGVMVRAVGGTVAADVAKQVSDLQQRRRILVMHARGGLGCH